MDPYYRASSEAVILVRDHVGNCFDVNTLRFFMPSNERWHCVLTAKEKEISSELHLFDWKPYERVWGDEYVSTRQVDAVLPD